MKVRAWAFGVLAASAIGLPPAARAQADCAWMFNRIAAQLNDVADRYDRIHNPRELCRFSRETALPLRKAILDEVEASRNRCRDGAWAVRMARQHYDEGVSRMQDVCRRAGM
jgi:hypothetical protein